VVGGGLSACAPVPTYRPPSNGTPFTLGVMSGLHSEHEAVLWTRLDPDAAPGSTTVRWTVATDPSMSSVVASEAVDVGPDADWTAKVLVGGLAPDRSYWYRFAVGGPSGASLPPSPVGRARTLPAPDARPDRLRLAFGSCQQWTDGWYTAWGGIAAEDLDAVVWLGDYIYESGAKVGPTDVRVDTVGAVDDLDGYRAKYRLYRSDPLPQAGHAAHPFVPIWDDHEVKDDYTRLDLVSEPDRVAAAYRAWFEYMPVWPIEGTRTYRRLRWGDLADLSLLDTRQYRDHQANGFQGPDVETLGIGAAVVEAVQPGRTILGDAQRAWLLDGLDAAQSDGVRWKLVGNQVMITPIRPIDLDQPALRQLDPSLPHHAGVYANMDSWDSYMWERDLLLGHLADGGIEDVSFLTGDIHTFFQSTVTSDFDDPSAPKVANEFVGGSVSSQGVSLVGSDPLGRALEESAQTWSPAFRYSDFRRNGYGVLDATPDGMAVTYRACRTHQRGGAIVSSVRFDLSPGDPVPAMTPINP
jgi:alkaline phosphatase D